MTPADEQARRPAGRADHRASTPQLRVYRWIGLLLAPVAVALAVLTPNALLEIDRPSAAQPTLAFELPAAAVLWINAASADELARELPGIGPLYAERITTHRRLFGPITEAQTLIDLGIPTRVVDQFRSEGSVGP